MPYTTLLPLELVLVTRDCYSLLPQPHATFPVPLQTIQRPLLFHDSFDAPQPRLTFPAPLRTIQRLLDWLPADTFLIAQRFVRALAATSLFR